MKKSFLVLATCLITWAALPASAASFFPAPFYGLPGPEATPPSDGEGVAGPEAPSSPLTPYRDQFGQWLVNNPPAPELPLTPPSAVPLPAAAWLFASAIVGLVSIGRRKRS